MKSALLGLSLFANIALVTSVAYIVLSPSTGPATTAPAGDVAPAVQQAAAPTVAQPVEFKLSSVATPSSERWASPADINAWLKESGAPLNVRYALLNFLMMEKHKEAITALRFPAGMKRWQRGSTPPTPEQGEKIAALQRQQQQELQALFGADYAKARFGAEAERESGIATEKRVEMDRIARDYMETRMKLGAGSSAKERALLESEMQRDMAAILTPQEFETYQAYESPEGNNLQRSMRGLDVDDETYLKIFRIVTASKDAEARPGSQISENQLAAIEKDVVADVAAHIAANQNATFREISTLYSAAGITSSAMLERYRIWNQFHADPRQFQIGISGQLDEAQLALARSYYDRLTDGLSTEARAQFDRTNTGKFMNRLLSPK
jgi:hypothetical protein